MSTLPHGAELSGESGLRPQSKYSNSRGGSSVGRNVQANTRVGGAAVRVGELFDQATAYLLNDPKVWFPSAKVLSEEDQSEVIYVNALQDLLEEYRVIVKSGYPIGLNAEVTNALLGDNPKKVAVLDQAHPRINDEGELVDQWGTPYFFHAQSLQDVSVRSAGEDRKMYTDDDVLPSGTTAE